MAFTISGGFDDGYLDQRYRADITASGTFTGPLTFDAAASDIPAWAHVLVYSGSKAMVWGTPDQTGGVPFTVVLKDAGTPAQTAKLTAFISIAPAPPPAGVTTASRALPGGDGVLLGDNSAAVWNTSATLPGGTAPATMQGIVTTNDAVLTLDAPLLTASGTVTTEAGAVILDVALTEGLLFSGSGTAQLVYTLREKMKLAGTPTTLLDALVQVGESIGFADVVGIAYRMLLAETIKIAGDATAWRRLVLELQDALVLASDLRSTWDAQVALAAAIAFGDSLGNVVPSSVAEGIAFGSSQQATLQTMVRLLETLRIADAAAPSITFTALLDESMQLGATASVQAEFSALLKDGVEFLAQIALDNGVYLAWVVNTEAKAFTRYSNYPFNSFAQIGGRYYGAREDGIYELAGDDDAGAAINAFVRGGLSDLGTSQLKRAPAMYLGYTAGGRLVMKVTAINDAGVREEHWYSVEDRPAGALREGRVKIGRGLKSTYWGWELANVDGADFALDQISWVPMVLERRL